MSVYLILLLLLNNFRVHSAQEPDIYIDYNGVTLRNCGLRQKHVPLSENCFKWQSSEDRQQISPVGNGREAYKDEFPWTAYLYNTNWLQTEFCTATLLNTEWMITAAHCVEDSDRIYDVYFGSKKERGWITVEHIFTHPDYNNVTLDNDIALLMLEESVQIDYSTDVYAYNGICLPEEDYIQYGNYLAVLTGWGRVSQDGNDTDTLRVGLVRTFRGPDSRLIWSCMHSRGDSASAHSGDSGAPLFRYANSRAVIIGVHSGVSYHSRCPPQQNIYNAYTYVRVSLYVQWINDTIFNDQSDLAFVRN